MVRPSEAQIQVPFPQKGGRSQSSQAELTRMQLGEAVTGLAGGGGEFLERMWGCVCVGVSSGVGDDSWGGAGEETRKSL